MHTSLTLNKDGNQDEQRISLGSMGEAPIAGMIATKRTFTPFCNSIVSCKKNHPSD